MFSRILLIFFAFSISVVCSSRTLGPSLDDPLKVYMVQVDFELYHGDCNQYLLLLKKVLHERSPKEALVYCYKEVTSGFAAKLTDEEAEKLKREKGVYGVATEEIDTIDIAPYSYRFPKDINY